MPKMPHLSMTENWKNDPGSRSGSISVPKSNGLVVVYWKYNIWRLNKIVESKQRSKDLLLHKITFKSANNCLSYPAHTDRQTRSFGGRNNSSGDRNVVTHRKAMTRRDRFTSSARRVQLTYYSPLQQVLDVTLFCLLPPRCIQHSVI